MNISRIQIEEGFLNGLDLRLPAGLIAVIGARGTGKTSLIEILRYALAARNHTPEAEAESLEHARSVLEGGEVTVTMDDLFDGVVVTRSGTDDAPRSAQSFHTPIMFSQKEIETVGLSEAGRLSLIDGFIRDRAKTRAHEGELANSVRSLYREMSTLESEIVRLSSGLEELPTLRTQVTGLEAKSVELTATSAVTAEKSAKLDELTAELTATGIRTDALERLEGQIGEWTEALEGLVEGDFGPEEWSGAAKQDPLQPFREPYAKAVAQVRAAQAQFVAIAEKVRAERGVAMVGRQQLETSARTLRGEVEKLVEGAGAVTRQLGAAKNRVGQLEAVEKVIAERRQRVALQRKRRDGLLNELEAARDLRFQARKEVADKLNKALGPRLGVAIEKFAQYGDYTRALTEAFRGSGLKYNDLAAAIAESVSPRELVRFVEEQAFVELAQAAGLPRDRAARAIGALQEVGLAEIVTCSIEDNVRLRLLDGAEYKDISTLSAGQRCTVVLPIVMQHDERVLVIDQPEDHIDNAFITETLIKAINSRSPHSQLIVSTHNANIPVLGNATLIIQLTSDGRNGSIEVCKPLDDPAAVNAITSVMEGGMEAFRNRAAFYDLHSQA